MEGTWSASVEWLVRRLAPSFPELAFTEVRYRIKSWKRLDSCIEDARAAIRAAGSPRIILLGFSMGGAAAIAAADEPTVERVIGLAPWIPDQLDLTPVTGKRLVVLHGALDRWLPGIPGVSPAGSRRGFERARAHGARRALRPHPERGARRCSAGSVGGLVPLPRAERWAGLVGEELQSFVAR